MLILSLEEGYSDLGENISNKVFWDLKFNQHGKYLFYLLINSKKYYSKKKFKLGIMQPSPKIIGKKKSCIFNENKIDIASLIIDKPSQYHIFLETNPKLYQNPNLEIKLMIRRIPIAVQGYSTSKLILDKNPVEKWIYDQYKKHSKVVEFDHQCPLVHFDAYYQNFEIIESYPFTFYGFNFDLGTIGILDNGLDGQSLNISFWKNYKIIINNLGDFKIKTLDNSPTLRLEKPLKNNLVGNHHFLIWMKYYRTGNKLITIFRFFYGIKDNTMTEIANISIEDFYRLSHIKFYLENLGFVNGHLYQRNIILNLPWGLTTNFDQIYQIKKINYQPKDVEMSRTICQKRQDGLNIFYCGDTQIRTTTDPKVYDFNIGLNVRNKNVPRLIYLKKI